MGLLSTLFGGGEPDDEGGRPPADLDETDLELDGDYGEQLGDDGYDDYGVAEVVITCDNGCGTWFRDDVVAPNAEERFAAAREFLATIGWHCESGVDICAGCCGGAAS